MTEQKPDPEVARLQAEAPPRLPPGVFDFEDALAFDIAHGALGGPRPLPEPWDGRPGYPGWHWLVRKRDGDLRMGFHARLSGWRVSNENGLTACLSHEQVARLYRYKAAVEVPDAGLP